MFSKGASLASILIIGSTSLLSACSQNSHYSCEQNDPACSIPSPPREHKQTATDIPLNTETSSTSVPAISSEPPKPSKIVHERVVAKADQRMNVQVIEHIRKPTKPTYVKAKRYSHSNVKNTPSLAANAGNNVTYTIQLGAYRKASSRAHAINIFPDESELLLFTMRNELLGLSYGQFKTLSEAKAQETWLLEQGITDFVFRRLPRNAEPLD